MRRSSPGLLLTVTLASFAACNNAAERQVSAYVDKLPPPEEPLVMQTGEVGAYGGRFVVASTSAPETFNPVVSTTAYTSDITSRLFVRLTDLDRATQEDGPALASTWQCSSDALSCTFHLRRGASFSDGHPITAEDVVFSFAALNDQSVAAYQRDSVQMDGVPFAVEAPDAHTVVIRAPKPNGDLLGLVAAVSIIPKHVLEPALKGGTFNAAYPTITSPDDLVTSGAWRLKQFVSNERTVLTRNSYWFGVDATGQRLPYLNELVFLVVPDQEAADLKFRSGEVDAITEPSAANVQWYEEHQRDSNFTVHSLGPSFSPWMLFFNQNDIPSGEKPTIAAAKARWFRNPIFRRAVSMAIDRDAMIAAALVGRGMKSWAYETTADKMWGNLNPTHYDYDPNAARELLQSLGWSDRDGDGTLEDREGNRITFSLSMNAGNAVRVALGNFIRDDLAKLGIRVTLAPMQFNTLSATVNQTHLYDAVVMSYSRGARPDPFPRFWRSDGIHPFQRVVAKPVSPEQAQADQLANQIIGSNDPGQRKQWLRELQSLINEQAWVIWLPVTVNSTPIRNGFGNLRPNGLSSTASAVLWNAEEIFVKPQGRATN